MSGHTANECSWGPVLSAGAPGRWGEGPGLPGGLGRAVGTPYSPTPLPAALRAMFPCLNSAITLLSL